MVKVKVDMTGWKMCEHGVPDSRLTVIKQADDYINPKGVHDAQWLCLCECGNQVIVRGYALKSGRTKSCGCLHKEMASQLHKTNKKKLPKYELDLQDEHGYYGIGYCVNTNSKFYFDMNDYDLIKDYCWDEHCGNKSDYRIVVAKINGTNKHISMHQLLGCKGYDHEDRNPLNNRRYNLRPATAVQNSLNRKLMSNNTSGVTGVSWNKGVNKWVAYVTINKTLVNLGYFEVKDDAIKARLEAEVKYYGEFAPQKHLYEQYNVAI